MISCNRCVLGRDHPLNEFNRQPHSYRHGFWRHTGRKELSLTQRLLEIESFVDEVMSSNLPAFEIDYRGRAFKPCQMTRIGYRLFEVVPHLWFFDSKHDYSEKPYAFLVACWEAEESFGVHLPGLGGQCEDRRMDNVGCANWIVDRIREFAASGFIAKGVYDRRYESSEHADRIRQVVGALLHRHAKCLLVRVDFSYREDVRHEQTMDNLLADRARFYGLRRKHPVFQHLLGYVWAVEESKEKGPHCHNLFVFDGSQVRADITIGNMIRELWDMDITHGDGSSWCSNANKESLPEVAIGMIERSNAQLCENAIYFATYFAKDHDDPGAIDPQYVRMKPAGARIFGTSADVSDQPRFGPLPVTPAAWHPDDFAGIRWRRNWRGCAPAKQGDALLN